MGFGRVALGVALLGTLSAAGAIRPAAAAEPYEINSILSRRLLPR